MGRLSAKEPAKERRLIVVRNSSTIIDSENIELALKAINRQLAEHFEPHWHIAARLALDVSKTPYDGREPLGRLATKSAECDGMIYVCDHAAAQARLSADVAQRSSVAWSILSLEVPKALCEPWTVSLSREALQMVVDPEAVFLASGPHPAKKGLSVFHWQEICDPVQSEHYLVDRVLVANFVLPWYYRTRGGSHDQYDVLGRRYGEMTLRPLGVSPGGYVRYFNPSTGRHETFCLRGDTIARERAKAVARSSVRAKRRAAAAAG
jgi:hypothetical protein